MSLREDKAESKHKPSSQAETGARHHATPQASAEGDTPCLKTLLTGPALGEGHEAGSAASIVRGGRRCGDAQRPTQQRTAPQQTRLVQRVKRTNAEKPAPYHLSGFHHVSLQASKASCVYGIKF